MSEHGHHNENFFSKYVFSLDHKMISKQFLITGMVMGVIAMVMSREVRYGREKVLEKNHLKGS